MRSIGDVTRYVPGAGIAQGEGNRDTPVLRGNSTTADFFVDGIRDDVQYFRDLYNVDRVEVMKGPNAMIFGRGGSGGLINRVTRQATGAIVTEQIFRIPGIGSLLITAILGNDTPVVMGVTFVFACLVVLFNLIADIIYGWLDPRISFR